MPELLWRFRDRTHDFSARPLVMGIVNITPDSFSDGGQWLAPATAVAHAQKLIAEGADVLDIGGESTRPGAEPVPVEEELRRVLPVVREIAKQTSIPISIDTMKAEVARKCLEAGAHIINDVSAMQHDPEMIAVVRDFRAGIIAMHMQGTPQTMQLNPSYLDVVQELKSFFDERLNTFAQNKIEPETICLDLGFGFGKRHEDNFTLLARMNEFRSFQRPLCLGVSRKGFIGTVCERQRHERLAGSLALACFALAADAGQVLRVHDVAATRDAARLWCEMQKFNS